MKRKQVIYQTIPDDSSTGFKAVSQEVIVSTDASVKRSNSWHRRVTSDDFLQIYMSMTPSEKHSVDTILKMKAKDAAEAIVKIKLQRRIVRKGMKKMIEYLNGVVRVEESDRGKFTNLLHATGISTYEGLRNDAPAERIRYELEGINISRDDCDKIFEFLDGKDSSRTHKARARRWIDEEGFIGYAGIPKRMEKPKSNSSHS